MREQSIANSIEHKCMKCFGTDLLEPADILGGILSSDVIRKNLMYSLSIFLARYYGCGNKKYDRKVDDFLNKNIDFFNKSIDDLGEDLADKIVYEFEDILDMYKFA
ncbi:hypothetical protein [Intestinibacter bartlettii]|uniref:hypothetical protein n=1 Tax=Intestinibacter bartlettii TaxID=261299 RepID=UPI00399244BB